MSGASLSGRFMLPDSTEYVCSVQSLTPEGAFFVSDISVEEGMPIVAYLDGLGRLECAVHSLERGVGFRVSFFLSALRKQRLEIRIKGILDGEDGAPLSGELLRQHRRYRPVETNIALILEDGRSYSCEVLDISLGGAAVKTPILPKIGLVVSLGKMRGRVVRHSVFGVGIQFCRLLDERTLHSFIQEG